MVGYVRMSAAEKSVEFIKTAIVRGIGRLITKVLLADGCSGEGNIGLSGLPAVTKPEVSDLLLLRELYGKGLFLLLSEKMHFSPR